MVVRNANRRQRPRRIRDDARERIAVMAFSLAVSAVVALLLHLAPAAPHTAVPAGSQLVTR